MDTGAITPIERQLAQIRGASDADLVREYRRWVGVNALVVAGMVQWAKDRELSEARALLRYLENPEEAGNVD